VYVDKTEIFKAPAVLPLLELSRSHPHVDIYIRASAPRRPWQRAQRRRRPSARHLPRADPRPVLSPRFLAA
jgi:hypothetical protein